MELLARDFATSHADVLSRVPSCITVEEASEEIANPKAGEQNAPSPTHPQVIRTMEYIAAHLFDSRLTVTKVASVLEMYPTYLSEVFVEQMGQRMSRFIACRRVEDAKRLLATTDWQVKRIALETGHANANWFCHIFSVHAGLTPGEYRASVGAQKPHTPEHQPLAHTLHSQGLQLAQDISEPGSISRMLPNATVP